MIVALPDFSIIIFFDAALSSITMFEQQGHSVKIKKDVLS